MSEQRQDLDTSGTAPRTSENATKASEAGSMTAGEIRKLSANELDDLLMKTRSDADKTRSEGEPVMEIKHPSYTTLVLAQAIKQERSDLEVSSGGAVLDTHVG